MRYGTSTVIRATNVLSAILSLIIAVSLPVIYFSIGYIKINSVLAMETEINAYVLTSMINKNPLWWHYETITMEDFLARRPTDKTEERRAILNKEGVLLVEVDDKPALPLITVSHDFVDSGQVMGRLEISRSLRRLLDSTAYFALGGMIIGLSMYGFMRRYPLRSLSELLGSLNQLNKTLEQRIIEEVAKGREKDHLLIQQAKLASMGEMIGNIAHQWRQPLNNVGLLIQDLKNASHFGDLNEAYLNESVDKAMVLVQNMSATIDDFRYFFSPKKEPRKFSMAESIGKAISFVEANLKNSGIEIELDIKDEVTLNGFPNEYSQVLLNLLNNAKDVLIERGIERPKVTVQLVKEDDRALLTVRDNGGGIPADIIDKIFEPYFSTKKGEKGTGIGLYMSKMIIENNGQGKLTARNAEGGAEFTIEVKV
jgi:signal transduction histidine kinase